MKRALFWFGIATIAVLLFGVLFVPDINAVVDSPYTFGAHRGESELYVENTFEAIQTAAHDNRYKFIEFDLQYTKDKKIIVFHDLSLRRLQQKPEKIEDLTYDELQKISSFEIPLYEEVMELVAGTKKLNIEIKSQGNLSDDTELVDFLVEDLQKRGILQDVLLSSISADVVSYISTQYPHIPTGKIYWVMTCTYYSTEGCVTDLYKELELMGADYIMLHGVNLRLYDTLLSLKPDTLTLSFWHFDNSMYVIHSDQKVELW